MAMLAGDRLRPWGNRVSVKVQDGTTGIDSPDKSFDRFISAYVLDLLSPKNMIKVLSEAHRFLVPGGFICLVSLTQGTTALRRIVTRAWEFAYRRSPRLVGGCRPIELLGYLAPELWRTKYRNTVSSFGITSEIVVASRLPG